MHLRDAASPRRPSGPATRRDGGGRRRSARAALILMVVECVAECGVLYALGIERAPFGCSGTQLAVELLRRTRAVHGCVPLRSLASFSVSAAFCARHTGHPTAPRRAAVRAARHTAVL